MKGYYLEPNDNIYVTNDEGYFGLEGVILNSIPEVEIIPQYLIDGTIQRQLKGSYVAWFYDRKNGKIYISNDLLSKQSIYYYQDDGLVLVNTSLFDLCADLRSNGRIPLINIQAIQYFCNENVFCGDMTYEKNTFFLTAYSYLVIDCIEKRIEVKRLPIPHMRKINEINEKEAIEELEKLFDKACMLQWQKNVQYKKEQILTMSGGMDSRAVLLHMKKHDPNSSIVTYTYAQSGSCDEIVAKRAADKYNVENLFIPLDNCEFVYQREEIIDANEGQMFYVGSTGAILMAKDAQKRETGIVHTGLGGGEIMGDICSIDGDKIHEEKREMSINQQKNLDDIRRCLNFQKTTAKYFYAFSPFLYEDFFEYVMCLPVSMRYHRKLYIKWYKEYMNSDYPTAMSHSTLLKALNKIKMKAYKIMGKHNPADMNPLQYWYETKKTLREYIDKTWESDCKALSEHQELLQILTRYYNNNVIHKFAVLTVTGVVKRVLGYES